MSVSYNLFFLFCLYGCLFWKKSKIKKKQSILFSEISFLCFGFFWFGFTYLALLTTTTYFLSLTFKRKEKTMERLQILLSVLLGLILSFAPFSLMFLFKKVSEKIYAFNVILLPIIVVALAFLIFFTFSMKNERILFSFFITFIIGYFFMLFVTKREKEKDEKATK